MASSNDLPDFFAYESGTPLKEMVEADKVLNIGAELERVGAMDMMNPSAVSLLKSLAETNELYDLPLGLNVEGFGITKTCLNKPELNHQQHGMSSKQF